MRLFISIILFLMLANLSYSGTVVVGWHDFEAIGEPLSNETPDEMMNGLSARMGNAVLDNKVGGSGGGQKVTNKNTKETPFKYGSQYPLLKVPSIDSAILLRADGSNANLSRLDFSVTNMTDKPLVLESIHLDCHLLYGTVGESWLTVSHLSAGSDLEDKPWQGFCASDKLYPQALTWHDGNVPLAGMEDLVLESGETAAFRIEVGISGSVPAGFQVDNIAIVAE